MSSAVRSDSTSRTGWKDTAAGSWDDLTADEQDLLLVASTEGPLWVVYERLGPAAVMRAATGLATGGFLWFYLLDDGYPDLPTADVVSLCAELSWWDGGGARCYGVGLYLTDAGEAIFPAAFDPLTG